MERNRMTTAQTAKAVREVLKREFPAITFSVRSKNYSGGSSITVYWKDGPTSKQVSTTVNYLQGADFDGMQDLKTYRNNDSGADYIFMSRDLSAEFLRRCAAKVAQQYRVPPVQIRDDGLVIRTQERIPGGYKTLDEAVMELANSTGGQ